MKNKISFLIVSLMLIAVGVQAETLTNRKSSTPVAPPEFQGNFSLKDNSIMLKSAKHELTIFSGTQDAQKFVSHLRAQNYACQNYDARHVKCSRFLQDLAAIDSSFKNVYEQYKDQKLEILPATSSAELLNDAEYLTEWKMVQNAKWMGQKFTDLYYSVIKDPTLPENIVKMKFTNGIDQRAYFYLVGHVGGVDIAFQQLEVLKLQPAHQFVLSEQLNCLLEVYLTKE